MRLIFLLLLCTDLCAQHNSELLHSLFSQDTFLDSIINQNDKYQVQILYTMIDRNENNEPSFTSLKYNVDTTKYFYPASSIKLPAAILALQKINELSKYKIDMNTYLRIDSTFSGQSNVRLDSTSESGRPSIAQYIRKLFLVSDNDAYNRLYEFLGQRYINEELWKKGFKSVRILHRLSLPLTREENQHTNSFSFYRRGKIIYYQPAEFNPLEFYNHYKDVLKGIGYIKGDNLVRNPKDFSENNAISIEDLQSILQRIYFPEAFPDSERFKLTSDDYSFLYKYMSMLPRESRYPFYDSSQYRDNYSKFFIYGNRDTVLSEHIRIYDKIGMAYGYLIDNAYIADFDKKIEFLLTAVIYVNEDQIFNDDKYEYDQIGLPFMGHLGRLIYNHELLRKRKYIPDLSKFRIQY